MLSTVQETREPARHLRAEVISPWEYARLRRSAVFAGDGIDGGGRPVLLLPGFLMDDGSMAVMARWLRRTGHRPHHAQAGRNVGCAEHALGHLQQRLAELVHREGRPVALIGHSRGGHFARVLAIRRPELVAGVVTLGAPPLDPRAVHLAAAAPAVAVTLLGTLGVPGLMRTSCFLGRCCAGFRSQLAGPFPADVPFVAIYSKSDAVVDWHRLREPAAASVEVPASHTGLIVNHHAYAAVASALQSFRDRGAA
jgi:pimeloyl-ACP methyl ester carboxylesterase